MSDLISPQELQAILAAFEESCTTQPEAVSLELTPVHPKLRPTEKLTAFLEEKQKLLAEALTEQLSRYLQANVRIAGRFFHFIRFQEIVEENGKWQSSLALSYKIEDEAKPLLLLEEMGLIYAAVHALLGGGVLTHEAGRELTQLEWPVAELISNELIRSFHDVLGIKPAQKMIPEKVKRLLSISDQFVADDLILMGLELELEKVRGLVHFVFPVSVFHPTHAALFEEEKRGLSKEVLSELPLAFQVEVGPTRILAQELLEMAEGDVIKLDQSLRDMLTVVVGGKKKFLAQPGVVEDRRAVRIVKRVEEK